jgi:hypothetical protein
MTWLVWRQHRNEGLITLGVLALISAFLLITGLNMAHAFAQLGLSDCVAHDRVDCHGLEDTFRHQFRFISTLSLWWSVLPLLLGALVGAPLVAREVEQRTHLLVWTQSITRFRWLTMKLALVLVPGLLAFGVLLALLVWWYDPFAQIDGRFTPTTFDFEGPVWLAAALLALALGIFAGTLVRRTVLAIFLTLVLFLAIRLPVEFFWRPNYEPAITVTWPLNGQPPAALSNDDWGLSGGWIDAQGNETNSLNCSGMQTLQQCVQSSGYRSNYQTYQPADRFWTFQWIETGIYLGCAALALFATVWLVRRRLS